MKPFVLLTLFLGLALCGLRAESFQPADAEPLVSDRAFLLELAPGTRQARLQVRNEAGAWEVLTLVHLAGDEGFLKLRLPDDVPLEDCKAEISMSDPFPYEFYRGETEHELKETGSGQFFRGDVALDGAGGVAGAPEADDDGGQPDQVQESDLWQWRGDTLYFFNQQRGLQVFDLSDRANPRKVATLRMPAVGDQMYLLDDEHVLLLANYVNYSAYGWADIAIPYSSIQQTEAIVVRHRGDQLEVVSRVAMKGNYVESRLVGDRLYLVTQLHEPVEDEEGGFHWKQGLLVNGIRLADPAAPEELEPLELVDANGWFWNSVVTASPEHLLVTTSHYDDVARDTRSRVHVIPIGRELANLEVAHTVSLKSHLPDKFKLRVKDDILTTVTQRNVWRETLTTYVESFDLSGERARKLDELILAPQERLHATRFDGDRLYVVTFFVELRKDPLFVIDLTDPANLKSLGELEIPGWSTYLVPEGDRLLSVGIEENSVAISLFDVSDPSRLKLVERVYPGEGRSWSEANWDEKAVGYLTDKDLLLLPIQTQIKTPNGYEYKNLMQIVDVYDDGLKVRGSIEHEVNGRRATALETDVVSLSGTELLVVDAADRDEPVVIAKEILAWDVLKVIEMGDVLWQIGQGNSWKDAKPTTVRVSGKATAGLDTPLAEFEMPAGGVAGTLLEGNALYVARYRQWNEEVFVPVEEDGNEGEPLPDGQKPELRSEWVNQSLFYTDVYDVSDPLAPVLHGSVEVDLSGDDYGMDGLNEVEGRLVDGRLIWYPRIRGGGHYGWNPWFFGGGGVAVDVDIAAPGRGGYYYGGYPNHDKVSLLVIDVSDPTAPALGARTVIDPKDYGEFGPMIFRDGRLLLSYRESFYDDQKTENQTIHRYRLRDVNYANPAQPVLGEPVSIPGILEGVYEENGGEILFTSSPEAQEQLREDVKEGDEPVSFYTTGNALLQASIYDGQQAFLAAETVVPDGRYTSTTVLGDRILKPGTDKENGPGLLVWRWEHVGGSMRLERDGLISMAEVPQDVAVHEGLLFAGTQQTVTVLEGDRQTEVRLSGPVYTQNLREVEVASDRSAAWLAVSTYGVEPLDLAGLADSQALAGLPALNVAAQVEGWVPVNRDRLAYVLAGGSDFVGPLGKDESWRFRASAGLERYEDWAMAHFNAAGDPGVTLGDPEGDADGDGSLNVTEFVYETDPTLFGSISRPRLDIRWTEEAIHLDGDVFDRIGAKDVAVVVERSGDLREWVATPFDSVEGLLLEEPAGGEPLGFYRLRLQVRDPE